MTPSFKSLLLSCICAAAAVPAAIAADADRPPTETMIVTATRIPTLQSRVLAPLTVIDRDEIERSGAQDLAELLRFRAGLDIGRNGGPGQTTSVFIRGTESNHTLVLVDGVRLNPGTIGGAAIQNLDPSQIERVEIVKGGRSSLYGSDAIGGVVNVITRTGARTARTSLAVGGGRYGSREVAAGVTTGAGDRGLSARVSFERGDGFPARTGSDIKSGYDNLNTSLDAFARLGLLDVGARAWRASGNVEYLDFLGVTALDQDYENLASSVYAALPLANGGQSRLELSLGVDDIRQSQSADFVRTRRTTLQWDNLLPLGDHHRLLTGLYAHDEDADAESFGSGFNTSTRVVAAFVEDNYSAGRHDASVALRYTDHETFGGETTWHLDYGFAASPLLQLGVSANTGYRAPDATDRFGFGGNPDLVPESSRHVEFSARYRPAAGQQFTLQLFETRIDDLVTFDFDPVTFFGRNRNLDEARIRGAEAAWSLDRDRYGVRLSLLFQDPRDQRTDQLLPRRAQRSATLNAFRRIGELELGFDVLATGERRDSGFSDQINAGYVLTNLSARMPVGRTLWLQGKIENALDANYETAAGFNSAGRGLYVTLGYEY